MTGIAGAGDAPPWPRIMLVHGVGHFAQEEGAPSAGSASAGSAADYVLRRFEKNAAIRSPMVTIRSAANGA